MNNKKLKEILSNSLDKLNITELTNGVRVSVPNDSRYVIVSWKSKDKVYLVDGCGFSSTYKDIGDVVIEILECLVNRELYDNNFSIDEINFVISKLLK